jgi:hypothetical protein
MNKLTHYLLGAIIYLVPLALSTSTTTLLLLLPVVLQSQ